MMSLNTFSEGSKAPLLLKSIQILPRTNAEVEVVPEDVRKELEVIKTFVAFEDVSENTTVNVEELSEEEKANVKVGLNDILTYKVVVENKGNVTVDTLTATDELIKQMKNYIYLKMRRVKEI